MLKEVVFNCDVVHSDLYLYAATNYRLQIELPTLLGNCSQFLIYCFADVDECLVDNGGCQHICENLPGNYTCYCLPGYAINADGKACNGIICTVLSYGKQN